MKHFTLGKKERNNGKRLLARKKLVDELAKQFGVEPSVMIERLEDEELFK